MSKFKQQYKKDVDLPLVNLKIHNVGCEACDPNHNWSGFKEFFSIHHIIAGKGTYIIDDIEYKLSKGDTFLVYPDTKVSYTADGVEPWEYLWIGISGVFLNQLIEFTKFSKDNPIIYSENELSYTLAKQLMNLYNSYGNGYEKEIQMIGLTYILLSTLMEKDTKYSNDIYDNYARQAKEYIELNYSTYITVKDIADKLNISISHLHRIFSVKFGFSPGKYINKLRIDRACFLLKNTTLSIADISNSIGFENQLYFSNVFKKYKSISPSGYRKNNMKK